MCQSVQRYQPMNRSKLPRKPVKISFDYRRSRMLDRHNIENEMTSLVLQHVQVKNEMPLARRKSKAPEAERKKNKTSERQYVSNDERVIDAC
jgi:hypothetical protein